MDVYLGLPSLLIHVPVLRFTVESHVSRFGPSRHDSTSCNVQDRKKIQMESAYKVFVVGDSAGFRAPLESEVRMVVSSNRVQCGGRIT
jgi:hypothetical protein